LRIDDLQIGLGDDKSLKPAPIDDRRRGHDEPDAAAVTLPAAGPPSFTPTMTSSEGGTSEFSKPVAMAE
jgi:hypothetical protein